MSVSISSRQVLGVAILTKGRRKVVEQVEGSVKHLQQIVRIFHFSQSERAIFPQRTGLYPSFVYHCSVSQDESSKSLEIFSCSILPVLVDLRSLRQCLRRLAIWNQ